jgi:hypothetical protein
MRLGRKIKDQSQNVKPELLKKCIVDLEGGVGLEGRNGNPMASIEVSSYNNGTCAIAL